MEDKVLDLVSKIYTEMSDKFEKMGTMLDQKFEGIDRRFGEIDRRFDGIDQRFDGIDRRLDGMDQRFDGIDRRLDAMDQRFGIIEQKLDSKADKLDIVRLENIMDTNFKALYDGYKQNSEQIARLEVRLDALASSVDRHEVVIRVLKGGKDLNAK